MIYVLLSSKKRLFLEFFRKYHLESKMLQNNNKSIENSIQFKYYIKLWGQQC